MINLTTGPMTYATDFIGVRSGKDLNKLEACHLTYQLSEHHGIPMLKDSPVSIECEVTQIIPLGTHDMFLAKVVSVWVDDKYMDETQRFHLDRSLPICYSHGYYHSLGKSLGKFGYSVEKPKKTLKKHSPLPATHGTKNKK